MSVTFFIGKFKWKPSTWQQNRASAQSPIPFASNMPILLTDKILCELCQDPPSINRWRSFVITPFSHLLYICCLLCYSRYCCFLHIFFTCVCFFNFLVGILVLSGFSASVHFGNKEQDANNDALTGVISTRPAWQARKKKKNGY